MHTKEHTCLNITVGQLASSFIVSFFLSLSLSLLSLPASFFHSLFPSFFLSSANNNWTNLPDKGCGYNRDRTEDPWKSPASRFLSAPYSFLLDQAELSLSRRGVQLLGVLVQELPMITSHSVVYRLPAVDIFYYSVKCAVLFQDLLLSTKNTTLLLTLPAPEWYLCGH